MQMWRNECANKMVCVNMAKWACRHECVILCKCRKRNVQMSVQKVAHAEHGVYKEVSVQ